MNAEIQKTPEEMARLQRHQEEFEQLKQDKAKSSQDTFYDEINAKQKKALVDKLIALRAAKADNDMKNLNHATIFEAYMRQNSKFNNQYEAKEKTRAAAHDMLVQSDIMTNYLIGITAEEFKKARERRIDVNEIPEATLALEEEKQCEAARERLMRIKTLTDIANLNISPRHKQEVTQEHKKRLARLRVQKDYQTWVEEDEIDIQADRQLMEIKNFKEELFFGTDFYE